MAHAAPAVDENLRQRLAIAMAEQGTVPDRFTAEVWLTDMSTRLKRRIPDADRRLHLLETVYYEATRVKLPPELVLALIDVESNFDRFAISNAGAEGLMQVMPFWVKLIGRPRDNLFHLRTNLRYGCVILRHYLDVEKGNYFRALGRYNGTLGKADYPDRVLKAWRGRWSYDGPND